MRASVCFFLLAVGASSAAAERVPLDTYLADIHGRFSAFNDRVSGRTVYAFIERVHVEIEVIVEKDTRGRLQYFVLEGPTADTQANSQKMSFDMILKMDSASSRMHHPGRVYSTRNKPVTHDMPGNHPSAACPPIYRWHLPDIYPVITPEAGD